MISWRIYDGLVRFADVCLEIHKDSTKYFGIGAMTVDILMTDNNNGLNFDEFCTVWISRISRTKNVQLWDMDACQNWVPQELDGYSTLQTTNKRIRL